METQYFIESPEAYLSIRPYVGHSCRIAPAARHARVIGRGVEKAHSQVGHKIVRHISPTNNTIAHLSITGSACSGEVAYSVLRGTKPAEEGALHDISCIGRLSE